MQWRTATAPGRPDHVLSTIDGQEDRFFLYFSCSNTFSLLLMCYFEALLLTKKTQTLPPPLDTATVAMRLGSQYLHQIQRHPKHQSPLSADDIRARKQASFEFRQVGHVVLV